MKRFLGVVVFLVSSTTHASTELKFGDLNYFFKKYELNIGATTNISSAEEMRSGKTTEKEGYAISTRLNFALTNRFYASATVPYSWDMKVANKDNLSNLRHTDDGTGNPRVGLNYRLIEQGETGYNLDFGAFYRFKVENERRGDSVVNQKINGTAATGRNAMDTNVRLGRKWNEANEFYLSAGAAYNFTGGFDQLSAVNPSVSVRQKGSVDYSLGAFYQYRPVNEFMMSFGGVATRYGTISGQSQGLDYNTASHTDIEFRFQAKYLVTEKIIANFNFQQAKRPDYSEGSTNVARRHFHAFGFGIDFLF